MKIMLCILLGLTLPLCALADLYPTEAHRIIVFVWDGLRPDSITLKTTPQLYRIMQRGVTFTDHHASYPTLTMMNAASLATGNLAGKTGFFGNVLWDPHAQGNNTSGQRVDFHQPIFTEDYRILQDLNHSPHHSPLLQTMTLCEVAHRAHLKTAVVGKSGPAFLQDYLQQSADFGIVFDEKHIYPPSFITKWNKAYAQPPEATAFTPLTTLKDKVTPDPTVTLSPYTRANHYLMMVYCKAILPLQQPVLSIVWLRNPDTTEHHMGVGTSSYYVALHSQDHLLGILLQRLQQLHWFQDTDIFIVSDHGHSNVSGSLIEFPLRDITQGTVSHLNPNGYSVSGDFRPADLLTRAGFQAYDGADYQYDPVLSGIRKDGQHVYPIAKKGSLIYTTPAYFVPQILPQDAIIVAANGGSTYLYVPDHRFSVIKKLVRFLQSREEFDAIFLDDRYGPLPGTLPLSLIHLKNRQGQNPDIIVGSTYDAVATIHQTKGIEYNSSGLLRGTHGSFSPIDVHNTLIAMGPDFKTYYQDHLPTANIDLAPTIAYLLHLTLPLADGRPLLEALKKGTPEQAYRVSQVTYKPIQPAVALTLQRSTTPDGHDIDPLHHHYTLRLYTQVLDIHGKRYIYFDSAKAYRY